jgi:hypothetical protein
MTKKPPIRKDEQALSDKEMLRRWLYGEPCLDKVEEDHPAGFLTRVLSSLGSP